MLTKEDIKVIKGLLTEQKDGIIEEVKDIVDFAIEKSELRTAERFNKVDREINDLIETNQAFLEKFDDHEKRLRKLEVRRA